MKKSIILSVSVLIVVVVLGVFFIIQKNKNVETIIDLGNGWKSYSNKEIGITVRIPADTETKYELEGDKKEYPTTRFSKGPIALISSTSFPSPGHTTYEEEVAKYRKKVEENSGAWRTSPRDKSKGIESRDIDKEIEIDGKTAFIQFTEKKNDGQNSHTFTVNDLKIPGETQMNRVLFFSNTDNFYKQYPQLILEDFSDETLEQNMQKHINVIKDLIISVDDF